MPDTDSEVETARILSKNIPEWEKLDKNERAELAKLIVAHRKRGSPAKVKLVVKPGGGYSIDMAGKSQTLEVLKLHQTFAANTLDPVNARPNEMIKYPESVGACNQRR